MHNDGALPDQLLVFPQNYLTKKKRITLLLTHCKSSRYGLNSLTTINISVSTCQHCSCLCVNISVSTCQHCSCLCVKPQQPASSRRDLWKGPCPSHQAMRVLSVYRGGAVLLIHTHTRRHIRINAHK